jgi:hypothetical protein
MGEMYKVLQIENLKGKYRLRDLRANGKVIFNKVLNKCVIVGMD